MSEIKLRDYQRECIDAVFNAWGEGLRRPAVVLPTGAGKTVVFSHLVREFRTRHYDTPFQHTGLRVIILVHRDELADQAISKLRATLPDDVTVGKVKAESNETGADVMVCSVQTLASKPRLGDVLYRQARYGQVGLIITDECHHGAAATYRKIYAAFPNALQLGVTATLARGDGVGLGDVWEEVVYTKSLLWMIGKGYLADVKAKRVELKDLDFGSVKKSRGDFSSGDLGRALEDSAADEAIARAYKEHAADRPGVVFTPTVATAETAAESLNGAGIVTRVISGETPRQERQDIFRQYREGSVQVLANCMVLTEGFDAPWASCAVIARPTQSNPLYVQMVGRVLRPWPGKQDALVLDVVGTSGWNKLQTLVDLDPTVPVREVGEEETLADAVVREAEEGNQVVPVGSVAFSLKARDVNLFAASTAAWLRTPGGVFFISHQDGEVFLWPNEQPELWDVCFYPKGRKAERTKHVGLELGMALAWGEAEAEDGAGFSTQKKARWRSAKPSEGQVAQAQRMGIEVAGLDRGQVSDLLSVAFVSRRLDRVAKSR